MLKAMPSAKKLELASTSRLTVDATAIAVSDRRSSTFGKSLRIVAAIADAATIISSRLRLPLNSG